MSKHIHIYILFNHPSYSPPSPYNKPPLPSYIVSKKICFKLFNALTKARKKTQVLASIIFIFCS